MDTERRVELSKIVQSCLELAMDNAKTEEEIDFVRSKFKYLFQDVLTETEVAAMITAQAREFEKQIFPFGKHAGCLIVEVSTDYLCSLFDPSDFMKKLKLYLQWRLENERN